MNFKTASLKVSGGLFALAMVGAAFSAKAPVAGADPCPAPPCYTQYEPGGPGGIVVAMKRADLTVKNLTVAMSNGGTALHVSFQIKNQGTVDAHNFQGRVMINGVVVDTFSWVTVVAGDTVGQSMSGLPLPVGTKLANVQVDLDTTNAVSESNETNNWAVKTFFIP